MPLHTLTRRLTLGMALAAAGIALLLTSPGVALAHHVELADEATCNGWTASAEYIGGNGDRMVVVDVWVNDEHIQQTFIFDEAHLGHQDYYLLYERAGAGALETSGTVKMYERGWHGTYNRLVDTDYTGIDLVCAEPTPTASATATPMPTDTPVPTATSTPTSEDTPETSGSVTPLPTETPDTGINSTITPLPTETSTPSTQGSVTPLATNTPSRGGNTRTATPSAPSATPTFTDEVRGSTPPAQPPAPDAPSGGQGDTPETGNALPNAGEGGMNGISFLFATLGFGLVIVGIATVISGRTLRTRK